MKHQREDLAFGAKSEIETLPILQTLAGSPLIKTAPFHPMDYTNEAMTVFVELKTRRIRHDQYPTALIGKNKIDFCFDPATTTYYFCFSYNDGLYSIKYDPEVFKTFRVEDEYVRSPRYGCANIPQKVVHIPHEFLTKVNGSPSPSQVAPVVPVLP